MSSCVHPVMHLVVNDTQLVTALLATKELRQDMHQLIYLSKVFFRIHQG